MRVRKCLLKVDWDMDFLSGCYLYSLYAPPVNKVEGKLKSTGVIYREESCMVAYVVQVKTDGLVLVWLEV